MASSPLINLDEYSDTDCAEEIQDDLVSDSDAEDDVDLGA